MSQVVDPAQHSSPHSLSLPRVVGELRHKVLTTLLMSAYMEDAESQAFLAQALQP